MTTGTRDTAPEVGSPGDPIGGSGAAFFDVDRTLIAGASVLRMVRPFRKRGLLTHRMQLRSMVQQLGFSFFGASGSTLDRFTDTARTVMAGWEQAQVREVVEQELERTLRPTVYQEALERIELHKRQGHPVYAVSATMIDIIEPFATMIGLDGALGTEMEVQDGKYTGEIARFCHGANKAIRLREFAAEHDIDLAASVSYSDSATDADFLRATGRAFAVNPDRELRRLAEQEGWGILYFRTRVKAPVHHHRAARMSAAAVVAGLVVRRVLRSRRARR